MASSLQMAADKAFDKLPYGMQRIGKPEVEPAMSRGSSAMKAGVEEGNPVSPMFVKDEKNFENPDYAPQLLRHEQTHRMQANWPEPLQKQLPPINRRDPYSFGGIEGIEKIGADPMKLSPEQMAAAEQTLQAAEQNGNVPAPLKKLDENFQAIPLSVMQPTDPNGKGINTMPRTPGLPMGGVWGTGKLLEADDVKPVKAGSGDEDGPWKDYQPQQESGPWEDYGPQEAVPTAPVDTRNKLQKMVDTAAEPDTPQMRAKQNPVENALSAFGKGATQTLIQPLVHPIQSLKSLGDLAAETSGLDAAEGKSGPIQQSMSGLKSRFSNEPMSQAIPETMGNAAGMFMGGELGGEALGAAGDAGSALREAAMGDPDAAALKGLRVAPKSSKVLSMQQSVQTARPYLQGAESLEDLQARIPGAKQEIWNPYQQTIDTMGKTPVKGPDGMTTIQDLEQERLQLSALNRGLKMREPEAIQLAQQKGLTQAQLLDRERAVKAALDPELAKYGINPQGIRQNFGAVSRIGNQVSGKSTLLEQPVPSGFGRMLNMRIDNPRSWIGEPAAGVKDLVAGRPLWSANPTDLGIKEGFRGMSAKPDLGKFTAPPMAMPRQPLRLPSDTIGNAPFGEDFSEGGYPSRPSITPKAPEILPRLPAKASEGEVQPMIGTRLNRPPEVEAPFRKERILPTRFTRPMEMGTVSGPVNMAGQVRPLKGLLDAPFTVPADDATHIYPPGSQFRDFDEQTYYPKGSKFQRPKEK